VIAKLLMCMQVELRDAIRVAIPSLNELLKSRDISVLSLASSTLAKMAENGKWQPATISALLMHVRSRIS
jgi:hypothetical protein